MTRWIPLFLLPLLSCAQKEYTPAECASLASPNQFLQRCMGGKVNGDYIGDLKCWPFSKRQHLDGVLAFSFEHSVFYPNATTRAQIEGVEPRIWFEDESIQPPPKPLRGSPDGTTHVFLVQAEGRLSLCDGWFGHLGHYPREFIASRILSARGL